MKKTAAYILISLAGFFVVTVLIGIYFAVTDSYPIELVDWRPIDYGTYKADTAIAINYYDKTSGTNLTGNENATKEIERAIMENLVEDKLIEGELNKRIKADDLGILVDEKINSATKDADADTKKQVMAVYGISMADFGKLVLEPQAKRDILEGRLLLDNNEKTLALAGDVLSEWLRAAKAKANVIILLPGFFWDGKGVVIK